MRPEKEYSKEFIENYQQSFSLMRKSNIHIFKDDSNSLIKTIEVYVNMLCMCLFFVSYTTWVIMMIIDRSDILKLVLKLPVYIALIQAFIKSVLLAINQKGIKNIITHLGRNWRVDGLTAIQTTKKYQLINRFSLLQKAFYFVSISCIFVILMEPIVNMLTRKFILHQETKLVLPFPSLFPFDPFKNWLLYITVYIFQVYGVMGFVYAYMGAEFLMGAFCLHLIVEFTLLREDLLLIKPKEGGKSEDFCDDEIKKFVKRHQDLIMLCNQLDDVFNGINFTALLSVTTIICLFAFSAKVSHDMLNIFINCLSVFGILMYLFIMCLYSELLANEAVGVAESAYSNLWYNCGTRYHQKTQFIIMRSQKICCFTCLKFTPISLNTFSRVLSSTWSFLSLIMSVLDDEY
uniref:Odorant receptor n=1 Tax=Heortia vitessoides TaxID=1557813 RepID=A0A978W730_9NEOP|nr:odorant receptor 33 [Heortia vitessoides]